MSLMTLCCCVLDGVHGWESVRKLLVNLCFALVNIAVQIKKCINSRTVVLQGACSADHYSLDLPKYSWDKTFAVALP